MDERKVGGSVKKGERFEDLVVWQKGMNLVERIYSECRKGPVSKDWGLRDQLQRAAVSIPANIAEGYERDSRKEYIRFLVIAKGSAGELRCLVQIGHRIGFLKESTSDELLAVVTEISKMLKGLTRSLKQ